MNSVFVEVKLLVEDPKQRKELFKFLEDYSGSIDWNNLLALELSKPGRII